MKSLNWKKIRRYYKKNRGIIVALGAMGLVILFIMSMAGVFIARSLIDYGPAPSRYVEPPDLSPTATPAPAPTTAPTPAPTAEPAGQDEEYNNSSEFLALQARANDSLTNRSALNASGVYSETHPMNNYPWIKMGYNDSNLSCPFMWTPEKFYNFSNGNNEYRFQLYNMWIDREANHKNPKLSVQLVPLSDYLIINHSISGKLNVTNLDDEPYQGTVIAHANITCRLDAENSITMGFPSRELLLSITPYGSNEFTKTYELPAYIDEENPFYKGLLEGPIYAGAYTVELDLRSSDDSTVLCSYTLYGVKVSRDTPSGPSIYN